MTSTTATTQATTYPLTKLAKELDQCSPELRHLLRLALAGANGERVAYSERDRAMAAMRLNEANTTRTVEAHTKREKSRTTAHQVTRV